MNTIRIYPTDKAATTAGDFHTATYLANPDSQLNNALPVSSYIDTVTRTVVWACCGEISAGYHGNLPPDRLQGAGQLFHKSGRNVLYGAWALKAWKCGVDDVSKMSSVYYNKYIYIRSPLKPHGLQGFKAPSLAHLVRKPLLTDEMVR